MLHAILYARFHPLRGPSIIHQYPPTTNLFPFSSISTYIIPPYELCNQSLAICINGYRVLGFPVSLYEEKYERNRFTFNVCFVLDEGEDDVRVWERVVAKTAGFFVRLEESGGLLQAEEEMGGLVWAGDETYPAEGVGVVFALLGAVWRQLRAYGETCVRVKGEHVLNLRLSKPTPSPTRVRAWDVPLLIRTLPHPDEWTWDLALQQIHPHIDGINHIQRIAELADVEIGLVSKTVAELIRHNLVMLLDIFHSQAVYTLTSKFPLFANNDALLDECVRYVTKSPDSPPTAPALLDLYRHLTPGLSVRDFLLSSSSQLINVDIRRLITFGVIKGFLRRVHKYVYSFDGQSAGSGTGDLPGWNNGSPTKMSMPSSVDQDRDGAYKRAAFSSGWATPPAERSVVDDDVKAVTTTTTDPEVTTEMSLADAELRKFLTGNCCLDEICVAMHMPEKEVMGRLRSGKFGEVVVFAR